MLTVAILALAAAGGAPAAAPVCRQTQRIHAALYRPADRVAPQRLGELPPADHLLTVLRREDGCEKPAIVRSGIGVGAAPAR